MTLNKSFNKTIDNSFFRLIRLILKSLNDFSSDGTQIARALPFLTPHLVSGCSLHLRSLA